MSGSSAFKVWWLVVNADSIYSPYPIVRNIGKLNTLVLDKKRSKRLMARKSVSWCMSNSAVTSTSQLTAMALILASM